MSGVRSDVPLGSMIGPCLFLFYVNDIPVGIYSKVRLFADDTIMYMNVIPIAGGKIIPPNLDKLAQCGDKLDMAFTHRYAMFFRPPIIRKLLDIPIHFMEINWNMLKYQNI